MRTGSLHVRICELCVSAWIGLFDTLAIELLLQTLFIDRYILAIFYCKNKLVSRNSSAVEFVKWHNMFVSSMDESKRKEKLT